MVTGIIASNEPYHKDYESGMSWFGYPASDTAELSRQCRDQVLPDALIDANYNGGLVVADEALFAGNNITII